MTEAEFRQLARQKGYGEVEQGEVGPGFDEEMHTHEVSILSMTLAGEIVLTTEDETTVLKAGDWCEIPANTLHKEQTGAAPATYMMAKK